MGYHKESSKSNLKGHAYAVTNRITRMFFFCLMSRSSSQHMDRPHPKLLLPYYKFVDPIVLFLYHIIIELCFHGDFKRWVIFDRKKPQNVFLLVKVYKFLKGEEMLNQLYLHPPPPPSPIFSPMPMITGHLS